MSTEFRGNEDMSHVKLHKSSTLVPSSLLIFLLCSDRNKSVCRPVAPSMAALIHTKACSAAPIRIYVIEPSLVSLRPYQSLPDALENPSSVLRQRADSTLNVSC